MKPSVLLALIPVLVASPAFAQAGFYLPSGAASYGQDEFRAADGTTCRSTMDGTKRIELGAFGSGNRVDNNPYALPGYSYGHGGGNGGNAGVYGRFSMSLDAAPGRINCTALYRLEIERRTLELEMMKRSLVAADRKLDELRSSQTEPTLNAPPARGTPATAQAKTRPAPPKVATVKRTFPPP